VAALLAHPQADIVDALAAHTQAEVVATLLAHPQADIVAALVDHPQANIAGALAAHTLNTQQFGGVTNNLGHDATPDLETAAAGNVTIAGCISAHAGAGADVPHDLGGAAFAHVGSGTDIAHANGANPVAHVAGAAPLVHAGGADPVVAAVPTKVDRDTFSLSAALLVGDILRLSYIEEGGRMVP